MRVFFNSPRLSSPRAKRERVVDDSQEIWACSNSMRSVGESLRVYERFKPNRARLWTLNNSHPRLARALGFNITRVFRNLQILKTKVISILHFTRKHVITQLVIIRANLLLYCRSCRKHYSFQDFPVLENAWTKFQDFPGFQADLYGPCQYSITSIFIRHWPIII